jgi:shikimate kinase
VAPHAAKLLEASWCDLDERIVRDAGQPIREIFAGHGEPHFRDLERAALRQALDEAPQVIAAGAGWAAEPGNLESVTGRTLVIYLSIAPSDAAARLAGDRTRPLLDGDELERRITDLFRIRERFYRLADLEIATGDAAVEAVAAAVSVAARQYGNW